MVGRSGYRALPLGDLDRFQQSSFGFLGLPKDYLFLEPGSVGPGADAPQTWPSCLCHGLISFLGFLLLLITFPISGWFSLKIVPTYERMIVFRLGRIRTPQGPGMVLLLPFVDSFQRVDLRTRAFSVPPCKLASKDGAVLSVGADVQFRIWDPVLSVMTVKDLNTATRMTAQNAMTKALLKRPLREIQMEKLKISDQLLLLQASCFTPHSPGSAFPSSRITPCSRPGLLKLSLSNPVSTQQQENLSNKQVCSLSSLLNSFWGYLYLKINPAGDQRCDQGLGARGGPRGAGSGGRAAAAPGQPPPAASSPPSGGGHVLSGRMCPAPGARHLEDRE
ncbi:stomatin-like protein 1 isoform X4 [Phyllostomus hastatus]|uniref:stomatin-like protein 1 isoform X4 n=1 Tax=Phyllostomus hastatus TaxID=9423 RepID=UPI001E680BF0|nr:stomatin-like protein 1 isoform X4 [Phyllostomus hastatus]